MKKFLIILAITVGALTLIKIAISQSQTHTAIATLAQNSTATATAGDKRAVATFAGGCFWCIESTLEKVDGVIDAVSGYADGKGVRATYREITKLKNI